MLYYKLLCMMYEVVCLLVNAGGCCESEEIMLSYDEHRYAQGLGEAKQRDEGHLGLRVRVPVPPLHLQSGQRQAWLPDGYSQIFR